jgi:hypothetical protein
MPEGRGTICGGLPVIAHVTFTRGDGWTTDDDAEVDEIYWMKKDGTKGKPIPEHLRERAEKQDYLLCNLIEQVSDYLAYEQYERELMEVRCKPCGGEGVKRPSPWSEATDLCRRCKGTGTFVSRVRAGLPEYERLY